MYTNKTKVFNLNEYQVPDYLIENIELEINLSKTPIQTKAKLTIKSNPQSKTNNPLILNGENIQLTSISLNKTPLDHESYTLTDTSLSIPNPPQGDNFTLETTVLLGENTDLFGLYETEGTIIVKAETEGMRRVLYCLDRPDVLSTYRTTIIALKEDYPTLLSNGELIEHLELDYGLHSVTWIDTVPKPTYLFAIVAGHLRRTETTFKTQSGRNLPIVFYVPPQDIQKCHFAKEVLKQVMAWDENTYNLECQLVEHKIAGVDKYASGASEPSGLNLFNTVNLFAKPENTTDAGILRVLEVVAHEFLHYWSGNRVTIRDWFNLPFKEGLTTFRAAQFREELFGSDLIRLHDGKNFDERAPRQSSYTAVRTLYTAAAYEKAADIFRMMMIYVGEDAFNEAMSRFLTEHSGAAVTLEQMLTSLTISTGKDLNSFLPWFTEDTIPTLYISDEYNENTQEYLLKVKTINDKSRPIPLLIGLLEPDGTECLGDTLIMVDQPDAIYSFENIDKRPTPSLLRSFSAPVFLKYDYTQEELFLLIQHDTNTYNRSEASNILIYNLIKNYCLGQAIELTPEFFNVYRSLLSDPTLNKWLLAELLSLPSEEKLISMFTQPNFEKIAEGRLFIQTSLAKELRADLFDCFKRLQKKQPSKNPQFSIFDIKDAGIRRLKELCFSYFQLTDVEQTEKFLTAQFNKALGVNMTETLTALNWLCQMNSAKVDLLLRNFFQKWKDDPNAMNYWFIVQASSHTSKVIDRVIKLTESPIFDLTNPNKVYALLGTFIKNPYGFHNSSGEGYELIANKVLKLEPINPTLAAKLTESFVCWDKYDMKHQTMMLYHLKRISQNAVSSDVKNMAKKGLDKEPKEPPLAIHMMLLGKNSFEIKKEIPLTKQSGITLN